VPVAEPGRELADERGGMDEVIELLAEWIW
jgi:hypothetical protein